MSKILELRNQRAKLYEQAKAYLEDHRGENGLVSAEDAGNYEAMLKDVAAL